ncbi:DUF1801 domain-containing protein [Microbacterium sp.]|uniref:iron chaperone n=1 Tax=Microbacterium sp. TaxID=51671 RepID=UPI002E351F2E|nr:DUF1801 domain-containing protein [Microbacterium sp.]HEX5729837.1 DUF1801 domain-containing protein [Microbacterium sp.]
MAAAATVDEYIGGFPPEVADRLQRIRQIIVAAVVRASAGTGSGTNTANPLPEEKIRYGIAAVMLGGRYALHFAGWKKHIGLYPVPTLDQPLESEIALYRAEKDSVVFPHSKPIPYDLIAEVADAVVARSAAAQSEND